MSPRSVLARRVLAWVADRVQPAPRSFDDRRDGRMLDAAFGREQVITLEDAITGAQFADVMDVLHFGPESGANGKDASPSAAKYSQQSRIFHLSPQLNMKLLAYEPGVEAAPERNAARWQNEWRTL
jgi:hypothetical protein